MMGFFGKTKTSLDWLKEGHDHIRYSSYEKAIQCFDKVLEMKPDNRQSKSTAGVWYSKGECFNGLKKYEEAIECFDKALEIYLNNSEAWDACRSLHAKGAALFELKRYEDSIWCYDKSIEIDPKDSHAWYGKGIAFCGLKKYEEAMRCFDRFLMDDHYDANQWFTKISRANAWTFKGDIFREWERYEEAIKCFDKAVEIYPDHYAAKECKKMAEEKIRNRDLKVKGILENLFTIDLPTTMNSGKQMDMKLTVFNSLQEDVKNVSIDFSDASDYFELSEPVIKFAVLKSGTRLIKPLKLKPLYGGELIFSVKIKSSIGEIKKDFIIKVV